MSKLVSFFDSFLINMLKNKKNNIRISPFAFCDKNCSYENNIYIDRFCIIHKAQIGRYSYVGYGTKINNANIGRFCSIASDVKIGLGKHPLDMVSTSPTFYSERNCLNKSFNKANFEESETVCIGNDVWIGTNVIIMDGVNVGDGVIIAAGSIITKDVKPYSIVAGIPGKTIRKRFDQETIDTLMESKWWDFTDEKLAHIGKCGSNINLVKEVIKNESFVL